MKKWLMVLCALTSWSLVWAQPECPPQPPLGIESEQTEGFPEKLSTPEQRLLVVNLTLLQLNSHYLNPAIPRRDWSRFIGKVLAATSERVFYDAMRVWFRELGKIDGQSEFFSARQQAFFEHSWAGAGIALGRSPEALNFVMQVDPGSPAEQAGLRVRDKILAVDGQTCWHPTMIWGEEGSNVTLTLQTAKEVPRDITLTRAPLQDTPWLPVGWRFATNPKVGYFWINSIISSVEEARAVNNAFQKLASASPLEGLILDLRGSRVYFDSIETILAPFVSGAVFKYARNYTAPSLVISPVKPNWYKLPMVVLVDSTTSENSVWFAAVLQRRPKTLVVGSPTQPLATDWDSPSLADGSRIKFPTVRFRFPDDSSLANGRVVPSILISENWLDYSQADDPYIKAALEALRKLR